MCGIAGWIDFARDLRPERETAQAMTAAMANRGPDDEGLWMSPHAAIGHRRLAVIDPAGGAQPMSDGEVVLTYSGEVYNFRELRSELKSAGHSFKTSSDTEVVLRAYMEWGAEMVYRLNGMYAFAVWDGRIQELLLVRDRMGVKPLYYYPTPDGALFGSEPKAILANPLARRTVNPTGLCAFLIHCPNPQGITPFDGVVEVQPATYVRVGRDGIKTERYWRLEARPHEDDLDTTIETVRGLLEDIVARQLVSDVPLCVLLSGGLDSSTITAMAMRANGASNGDVLRSFAVDFRDQQENFRPDVLRGDADAPYVHELARHVGCSHQDIVLETTDLWNPATRSEVLHAWDFPNHLGDMDISLYLLFRAISEHSTVAISGEAADEVFGGYPWLHDEETLSWPMFPWMALQVKQGTPAPFSLFSQELLEQLDLANYFSSQYNDAIAESPKLDGEDEKQVRMREASYLDLTRFVRGLLDRKDRTSMAVGLEVRVPFCDHRLVEYMWNVPWSMKTFDGREKSILRAAAKGLLPESVSQRPKSAFPATSDTRYDEMLRTELARIVEGNGEEPARPFVNEQLARSILSGEDQEQGGSWARLRIEGVVRTNQWLKDYEVDMSGLGELATA